MTAHLRIHISAQQGTAAVEFALVAAVFFTLLFGIMEMGRVLFTWNTAVEATRMGARMAVVCDKDDQYIKTKMQSLLPMVQASNINLTYSPAGCTVANCSSVSVSISNVSVPTSIPFLNLTLTLPAFTTTLTRESMQSSFNGATNPVC